MILISFITLALTIIVAALVGFIAGYAWCWQRN